MDPMIMGPLLILLLGGGVGAAFYFVARQYVGRSGRDAYVAPGDTRAPDIRPPR